MPENTNATAENTSEGEGKKTAKADATGDTTTQQTSGLTPEQSSAVQDEIKRVIAKERKLERESVEREQQERQDEQEKRFEKLANDRKAELDQVKPRIDSLAGELEIHKQAIADLVKAELKALPDEVREAAPARYGEGRAIENPLDVLAWLPLGKKLATALQSASVAPGMSRSPRPVGQIGAPSFEEQKQQMRASGRYGF